MTLFHRDLDGVPCNHTSFLTLQDDPKIPPTYNYIKTTPCSPYHVSNALLIVDVNDLTQKKTPAKISVRFLLALVEHCDCHYVGFFLLTGVQQTNNTATYEIWLFEDSD